MNYKSLGNCKSKRQVCMYGEPGWSVTVQAYAICTTLDVWAS